ncbi:hypothetical protein BJ165DRAFT_1531674 [Panaeolus papilionaceus]|nr:hypothetical protein BJ165DRAFT_1531674 [Panaeolus papilionaceus]
METQTLAEQEVRGEADRLRSETSELHRLVNELVSEQATQHGAARAESDRSQEWAEAILLSVSATVRQNLDELAVIHTREIEILHASIIHEQEKFCQQALEHAAAITALQQENRATIEQYANNLRISDERCQSAIRETEGIRRKLNECKVKFQGEKAALKTVLEEEKRKHKESVEKFTQEKTALETSHTDEIREKTNTHNSQVKRLEGEIRVHRTTLETEIAKLKEVREADTQELKADMNELNAAHQQSIRKLKDRHNQELERVTEQREAMIRGGLILGGIMVIVFQYVFNLVRQWLTQRYKLPA